MGVRAWMVNRSQSSEVGVFWLERVAVAVCSDSVFFQ